VNVGSLFSGIGGIDLGLERAGMRVVWQCERDPWCRSILARHWPGVPCYHDIRDIAPVGLPIRRVSVHPQRVDVLAGGFPCQPVSQAGKRLAQADERWLWPEFARCIRVLRPRYIVVENVPGLLTRGMGDVLGDLAALGFDAEWTVFGARNVGAPHRRDRVWIVAYANAERRGANERDLCTRQPDADRSGSEVADSMRSRLERHRSEHQLRARASTQRPSTRDGGWWCSEPDVGRVAHGVPARVDRLRALGNAVVPQCAEHIGRCLMEIAMSTRDASETQSA
jgi:DNA (cytosine-5)-methyltransferase 1